MSQEIISEIKNHTGIITLKTEDGLNAVNRRMLAEIAEAATAMDMNDEVKAIIIRGGEKAFSAGVDVNEFVADVNPSVLEEMYENFEKIADVKKPVIAAVSGYALGIGFEMALACDIVFASESACFGHPDLSLGTVPGFGATQRLPNTVGKSKTMEMILTGRAMNAREAERAGIVSRIIPLRYLFDEAFNKMDSERIIESVRLLRKMGLQAIICTPPDKVSDIMPIADRTLLVDKHKYRMHILPFSKENAQ